MPRLKMVFRFARLSHGRIQTDDSFVQLDSDLLSDTCHLRQRFVQERRLMSIARGCHKWREHIAVAIAEGNNFVPFEVLVPTESEVIAAFVRGCRRPISMNNADVEVFFLVKLRHRPLENGIKASLGFKASKGKIDSGVVNFRPPLFVLLDG
ncbi:MAG: hypothetical protein LH702_34840 [Phormidesmis sp. CAN_BIN44]|nr:hypothetical protein [Phormidesmis sp. CAN_BIN44]